MIGALTICMLQVAVDSRACRVYSDTALPSVWDRAISRLISTWPLTRRKRQTGASHTSYNVFGPISGTRGAAFPTARDPAFLAIVREHEALTGLPGPDTEAVPVTAGLVTADPYAAADATTTVEAATLEPADSFWTGKHIGVLSVAVGVCAVALLTGLVLFQRSRSRARSRKSRSQVGLAEYAVRVQHDCLQLVLAVTG